MIDLEKTADLYARLEQARTRVAEAMAAQRQLEQELAAEYGLPPDGLGTRNLVGGLAAHRLPAPKPATQERISHILWDAGLKNLVRRPLVLHIDLVEDPICLDPKFVRLFKGSATTWKFKRQP